MVIGSIIVVCLLLYLAVMLFTLDYMIETNRDHPHACAMLWPFVFVVVLILYWVRLAKSLMPDWKENRK